MPPACLFLDNDDTLYQNSYQTEARITKAMGTYIQANLGLSPEKAFSLYREYGTTLKGLLAEGLIDVAGAEAFLLEAHAIDYREVIPDPLLADVLSRLRTPTWIFTAGTREHAERCMHKVGLEQHLRLEGIVDVRTCDFQSKHSEASFERALAAARSLNPSLRAQDCCLCDDSVKNIARAKAMGWTTVLVGTNDRATGEPLACEAADHIVPSLHSLPSVLPELFDDAGNVTSHASPVSSPSGGKAKKRSLGELADAGMSNADDDGVPRRVSIEL